MKLKVTPAWHASLGPLGFCALLFATLSAVPAGAQVHVFGTIAGQPGLRDVDGTNAAALFGSPYGITADAGGNLYVADQANSMIRKISPVNGDWVVSTIAGRLFAGWSDGTNLAAAFRGPRGIAVDSSTNLYVADTDNGLIRKLSPSGTNWVTSTLAGSGPGMNWGYRDGPSPLVLFRSPSGIAVDASGTCYVADSDNNLIRQVSSSGYTTTVAGYAAPFTGGGYPGSVDGTNTSARFRSPFGIVVTSAGVLYVSDGGNHTIRKITKMAGNWVVTTLAGQAGVAGSLDGVNSGALFNSPAGLALTPSGDILVTDGGNHTIRKIVLSGTNAAVTTIAGTAGVPGTADGPATASAFARPQGVVADAAGSVFVADAFNSTIRMLAGSGDSAVVSTIAGNPAARRQDGVGGQGRFWFPLGMVRAPDGTLYVADTGNHAIRSVEPQAGSWTVRTIAGFPGLYGTADGTNDAARFCSPYGITRDQNGDLFVADAFNHTIRRLAHVETNWVVTTIAGAPGVMSPRADGTNSDAHFFLPEGIAADASGNLFVADNFNCAVRKISRQGSDWVVTTIAGALGSAGFVDGTNNGARFSGLCGIMADASGNLFVADSSNNSIRKITPVDTNWVVTTIAGALSRFSPGSTDGTNNAARFSYPTGIAQDAAGNLYVADNSNNTIRKITPSGTNWITTTIAGLAGNPAYADGYGSAARFFACWGIASDPSGNLFVTDSINDTIRYGQPTYSVSVQTMSGQAIVSWPAAATNFVLETRSDTAPGPWTTVDTGIQQASEVFYYTNDCTPPQALFRLRSR